MFIMSESEMCIRDRFSADGTKLVITYTDNTTQEIAIPAYGTQCSHENVEYLVFEEHTSDKEGTYRCV